MAINPQIASGPNFGSIPITQDAGIGVRALSSAVEDLSRADALRQDTNLRVQQIDQQIAARERAEAEAAEASAGQIAMIKAKAELDKQLESLRQAPGFDFDTYQRAVTDAVSGYRQQALGAFTSDRVRQRFAPQIEADAQETLLRDDSWRRGQQAKLQGQAGELLVNDIATSVRGNPTPANFERQRARWKSFLETLPMAPAARAAAEQLGNREALSGLVDGLLARKDYDAAALVVGSAEFGRLIGEDGVKLTMRAIEAGKAADAAATAAGQLAIKKAAQERLDTITATIETGGLVKDSDLRAAYAQAQAAGVEGEKLVKFSALAAEQAENRVFGPAADPTGAKTRARLSQLTAIRAERPFTSDENRQFEQLMRIADKRRADDAELLKPNAGKTPQGDLQILAELDKRPADDRFDTANKVRDGLGYFGLVRTTGARAWALQGDYDLKAQPDLTKVVLPNGAKTDKFADEFRAYLGPATREISGEAIAGYGRVAEAIYAKLVKDSGTPGQWNAPLFARAVNLAMGARREADGRWYGGMGLVNDKRVVLPDWGTATDLSQRLSAQDFVGAFYRGKVPAKRDDVLKNFTPVLVEGGDPGEPAVYAFIHDATGQPLLDANNGRFQLTLTPRR